MSDDRFRERQLVCRINQDGRITGNFRKGAAIGANHGGPALHRFKHRQAKTFRKSKEKEKLRRRYKDRRDLHQRQRPHE